MTLSVSTIRRRLLAAGLIEPEPKKRPKSSYLRLEAELPNETWQSDFTHIWLANGTDTETTTWIDDHSRRAGRMHHVMICRPYKRTPVILIIDNLDIRVVNKTTGELLRHLKLNPEIEYQPLHPKT